MDNDLVSVSEQRFSRSMSKPVSGAGDEDTSLVVFEGDGPKFVPSEDSTGLARWTLRLP